MHCCLILQCVLLFYASQMKDTPTHAHTYTPTFKSTQSIYQLQNGILHLDHETFLLDKHFPSHSTSSTGNELFAMFVKKSPLARWRTHTHIQSWCSVLHVILLKVSVRFFIYFLVFELKLHGKFFNKVFTTNVAFFVFFNTFTKMGCVATKKEIMIEVKQAK